MFDSGDNISLFYYNIILHSAMNLYNLIVEWTLPLFEKQLDH